MVTTFLGKGVVISQDWQHGAMHTTDTPDTTLCPATLADAHRLPSIDSVAAGRRRSPTVAHRRLVRTHPCGSPVRTPDYTESPEFSLPAGEGS